MESNWGRILGRSIILGVGVEVKINEIKLVAPEAGELMEKFALFKKGEYRWEDTKTVD